MNGEDVIHLSVEPLSPHAVTPLRKAEWVAYAKVLVDENKDRIVGAHMVGHQGEDLIHLFALAMRHGIPASKLKDDVFAFPTYTSDIKNLF